jgi:hypothetical protein
MTLARLECLLNFLHEAGTTVMRPALLALALTLSACANLLPPPGPNCAVLRGSPMLQRTVFLGKSIPNRQPLSRQEWDTFAAEVITPRFPDGFTAFEARGQWRNPASGIIISEDTTVLIVAADNSPATLRKLDEISAKYRNRFNQLSVGLITAPACGAF